MNVKQGKSIVMMGATGAVGSQVVLELISLTGAFDSISKLTLLGRRTHDDFNADFITQKIIDVLEPSSYQNMIAGHHTAICTLGVGQPSKTSKKQLLRIDKTAALDFAQECKNNGVKHFQILTSIGSSATSKSFYLRGKGELEQELEALEFDTLSIFQPSVIITPTNRYGISQALTLAVWPTISKLMIGRMSQYRGIDVAVLGKAIAKHCFTQQQGIQRFRWENFTKTLN